MTLNTKDLHLGNVGVGTTAPYQTVPATALVDEFGEIISEFTISAGIVTVTNIVNEVEIKNDSGNPIPTGVPSRSPTTLSIASTTASTTIAESNVNRKGILINNQSTSDLYLSFESTATTANSFLKMAPDSVLSLDQQMIATNAIYGIWSSANGSAKVTEFE
jgi:hypothetical protein